MARFYDNSRYHKYAKAYVTTDGRAREVRAMGRARIPKRQNRGAHQRKDGQRLDHLAGFYLKDPTMFWEFVAHNERILPEAVAFGATVNVPMKGK